MAEDGPGSGAGGKTEAAEEELAGGWSLIMMMCKYEEERLCQMAICKVNNRLQITKRAF